MLKDRSHMFTSEFVEIIYCMPKEVLDMEAFFITSLKSEVPGIIIFEGIPDILDLAKDKRHRLVILDDLGEESYRDQHFKQLLTRISHHSEISLIMGNVYFLSI
jgi:hypothetical protein